MPSAAEKSLQHVDMRLCWFHQPCFLHLNICIPADYLLIFSTKRPSKIFCSVIQFCATAFAYYAQATAAQEIFGHTLQSLRGIKYLYKYVSSMQIHSQFTVVCSNKLDISMWWILEHQTFENVLILTSEYAGTMFSSMALWLLRYSHSFTMQYL